MGKLFFDHDDGEFLYSLSDDTAVSFDGRLMMRADDNLAMDLETGDLHMISGWAKDDLPDFDLLDQDDYDDYEY